MVKLLLLVIGFALGYAYKWWRDGDSKTIQKK